MGELEKILKAAPSPGLDSDLSLPPGYSHPLPPPPPHTHSSPAELFPLGLSPKLPVWSPPPLSPSLELWDLPGGRLCAPSTPDMPSALDCADPPFLYQDAESSTRPASAESIQMEASPSPACGPVLLIRAPRTSPRRGLQKYFCILKATFPTLLPKKESFSKLFRSQFTFQYKPLWAYCLGFRTHPPLNSKISFGDGFCFYHSLSLIAWGGTRPGILEVGVVKFRDGLA